MRVKVWNKMKGNVRRSSLYCVGMEMKAKLTQEKKANMMDKYTRYG